MRFRFAPGRGPAVAATAMVATSQAPATLAGLEVLRAGGNAADAAVAAAACLCVSEPMSNGLGGDGFTLVWDGERVHGLDAGGASPLHAPASPPALDGPESVVVPAIVAGWAELAFRYGRLGLDRLLKPAIDLAERGVAAGYNCSHSWARAQRAPAEFGPPPQVGEVFRIPGLAGTLRAIADDGPDAFYRGRIAEAMTEASWLDADDLARAAPQWVAPLSTRYRGTEIFEMPAPTQGVAALEALAILESLDDRVAPSHLVRAVALALEDARRYVRDGADCSKLIAADYIAERALSTPVLAPEPSGGTVYLCVVDGDGMAVSHIQSLYEHFGSGVTVPGTGIVLNNRSACFSVGGVVESGRRPYHTTIPGMLVEGGRLRGPFGVMGGFIQAQAHVQLISSLLDDGLDPQAALDRPRFRLDNGAVHLEEGLWSEADRYRLPGARIVLDEDRITFGGGQAIQLVDGHMLGGSDPRKDGFAAGW